MVEHRFAEPIGLEEDVLGTIENWRANSGHGAAGEGARLLEVALFRADGKVFRFEAGSATVANPAHQTAVFRKVRGVRRRIRSRLRLD